MLLFQVRIQPGRRKAASLHRRRRPRRRRAFFVLQLEAEQEKILKPMFELKRKLL